MNLPRGPLPIAIRDRLERLDAAHQALRLANATVRLTIRPHRGGELIRINLNRGNGLGLIASALREAIEAETMRLADRYGSDRP